MANTLPLIEDLAIYEGDDVVLTFTSRLANLSGYSIKFQVREEPSSRYLLLNLSCNITGVNTYSVTIPAKFTIGRGKEEAYYYGIELTSPSGLLTTDRYGPFNINERVTGEGSTIPSLSVEDVVETTGLKENELLKWSNSKQKFISSGLMSEESGDITTAANSVNIGIHDLGSSGRNIMITNRLDNRHFSMVGQEVSIDDSKNTNTYQRERGAVEEYQFGTSSVTTLTNPSWSFTSIADQTVFAILLWALEPMDNVEYCIYEQGEIIYREIIPHIAADDTTNYYVLSKPYELYTGVEYSATLRRIDGSRAVFRGNTSGMPWYKVKLRQFTLKELATREFAIAVAGSGSVDGTFKGLYDTPVNYGPVGSILQVNGNGNGLSYANNTLGEVINDVLLNTPSANQVLTYDGFQWINKALGNNLNIISITDSGIKGQIEDNYSNFVHCELSTITTATLPIVTDSEVFIVSTKNSEANVVLLTNTGQTINGQASYEVVIDKEVGFKWDSQTQNWELIFDINVSRAKLGLFRSAYLTQDSTTIKQSLTVANTPSTIKCNDINFPSDYVSQDLDTGIITFNKGMIFNLSVSGHVIREGTSGGDANWYFYTELSDDGGTTWVPLQGSTLRITFSSDTTNEIHQFSYSMPVMPSVGTKLRFRHVTDNVSSTMSIISGPSPIVGVPAKFGFLVGLSYID